MWWFWLLLTYMSIQDIQTRSVSLFSVILVPFMLCLYQHVGSYILAFIILFIGVLGQRFIGLADIIVLSVLIVITNKPELLLVIIGCVGCLAHVYLRIFCDTPWKKQQLPFVFIILISSWLHAVLI